MESDSINEEILRIKHELAARHGNDVARTVADARARQGNVVTRPPRPYKHELSEASKPPNQPLTNGSSIPAVG